MTGGLSSATRREGTQRGVFSLRALSHLGLTGYSAGSNSPSAWRAPWWTPYWGRVANGVWNKQEETAALGDCHRTGYIGVRVFYVLARTLLTREFLAKKICNFRCSVFVLNEAYK